MAKAGARLYSSEQDYTGLVALDPQDPNIVYMSTTIDPRDQADLHVHEIFKGVTSDMGASWAWNPITFNSQVDNLRPTVPIWDDDHTALVWMRGTYRSMFDYDLDIVGITNFGPLAGLIMGDLNGDRQLDLVDFDVFIANMYTDLNGLSPAQAYTKGDLNGDFKSNALDFTIFRDAFNSTYGNDAFESALSRIPEPTAVSLSAIAIFFAAVNLRSVER
jgi:hypothetical protein